MATITELNLVPARQETDWTLNVYVENAASGIDIRSAVPETKYGIKSLVITSNGDDEWVELLNGTEPLVGPVRLPRNIPYPVKLESAVYCNVGNALRFQTESDFAVHLIIEGKTGPPISSPSSSISASPSPSE